MYETYGTHLQKIVEDIVSDHGDWISLKEISFQISLKYTIDNDRGKKNLINRIRLKLRSLENENLILRRQVKTKGNIGFNEYKILNKC